MAELKAGSEDAYAWLIGEFHQPIYSLVYRIVTDPADAADTTQEVFLKVFRGMKHFHGESSLKTWIYRIAVHEASNRRRWWFRHKAKESSMEPALDEGAMGASGMRDTLKKMRADRTRNGVPLPDDTWAAIVNTAREVGVSEVSIQRAVS